MKNRIIKVLFIHHTKAIGGAAISMIKTIEFLDRSRFKPVVLLLKRSELANVLEEKNIEYLITSEKFYIKYYSFFSHYEPGYKWYDIFNLIPKSFCWILSRFHFSKKILKDVDFDIIHLNSSVLTDFLYAAKSKSKTVIHIREAIAKGYFGVRKSIMKRQIKRYADKVIAISEDNSTRLNLKNKTSVVYNFIEILDKTELKVKNQINKSVLYVGGSSYIKGFYTLIDALDTLDKNVNIIFAGSYPSRNSFNGIKKYIPKYVKQRKALQKMRSCKQAFEIGFSNEISQLIMDTEFLISPFSVEHFSRPIIEAFANGKTAIGSNVEGMNEIIDHKVNGLIVQKNNPEELANAINYLFKNQHLLNEYGKHGYSKALNLFSPNNVKKIEFIYQNLIVL